MSVAFEFATNNFDCTSNTTCKSQFFINQNCTKEIDTKIKIHMYNIQEGNSDKEEKKLYLA